MLPGKCGKRWRELARALALHCAHSGAQYATKNDKKGQGSAGAGAEVVRFASCGLRKNMVSCADIYFQVLEAKGFD